MWNSDSLIKTLITFHAWRESMGTMKLNDPEGRNQWITDFFFFFFFFFKGNEILPVGQNLWQFVNLWKKCFLRFVKPVQNGSIWRKKFRKNGWKNIKVLLPDSQQKYVILAVAIQGKHTALILKVTLSSAEFCLQGRSSETSSTAAHRAIHTELQAQPLSSQ